MQTRDYSSMPEEAPDTVVVPTSTTVGFFSPVAPVKHGRNPYQIARGYFQSESISDLEKCLNELKIYQHKTERPLTKFQRRVNRLSGTPGDTAAWLLCGGQFLIVGGFYVGRIMLERIAYDEEEADIRRDYIRPWRAKFAENLYDACINILRVCHNPESSDEEVKAALGKFSRLDYKCLTHSYYGVTCKSKTLEPLCMKTLVALVDELKNAPISIFNSGSAAIKDDLKALFRGFQMTQIDNKRFQALKREFNLDEMPPHTHEKTSIRTLAQGTRSPLAKLPAAMFRIIADFIDPTIAANYLDPKDAEGHTRRLPRL